MTVKSGASWSGTFVTLDATGALATPSVGPAGTLYVDGTANAASVTISGSNPYKWTLTLPTLTAGQRVSMYITATIATIATASVVAEEQADTVLVSDDLGYLKPTTAGRTLDVSAGGEAGIDWANVGSPTTTVGLSGTTVKTATDVETDTSDIQARLPAALVDGRISADMAAISADATAADNLEAMLDGTGGVVLKLAQLIVAATGDDSAVQITGSGAGHGVKIVSGATGQGLWLQSIAQYAAYLYGVQAGLYAYSTGASGYGIIAQAAGSGGHGMYLTGTGAGNGLRINAGVTAAALELVKAAGRYITAAAETEIVTGVALESTLTAIKGAGWTDQTLVAVDTVLDLIYALFTDNRGEPAQGAPPVSDDVLTKVDFLYTSWRNKKTQTATTRTIYDDAGTTALMKATDSDDGSTFTKGELTTGA